MSFINQGVAGSSWYILLGAELISFSTSSHDTSGNSRAQHQHKLHHLPGKQTWLTQVHLKKWPLKRCVCVCVPGKQTSCYDDVTAVVEQWQAVVKVVL